METFNPTVESSSQFTPEQQEEIERRRQILSSLAHFIGKDFRMPVELNESGAGWHWDFQKNVVRVDPKDLLERPVGELRYLICHEGGHRRISRVDNVPLEEWRRPGFSAMMNFIEDPRNDNFIEESYPKYGENIDIAWDNFFTREKKGMENLAMRQLGVKPKFMQAGYEYIRQWFNERKGKKIEIDEGLPEEVKAVVRITLKSARDSWCRYPSRQEADYGGTIGKEKVDGETMIKEYARTSYEINRDEIWPEFKKLVDADIEDQKVQELLNDLPKNQQEGERGEGAGDQGLPQDLKDKLTGEEQRALEDAIKEAAEGAQKEKEKEQVSAQEGKRGDTEKEAETGAQVEKPVDLKTLSEELKQKIKEYIESLPEERQKKIARMARDRFKEFEDALNEEIQGRLSDNPENKAKREGGPAEKIEQPKTKDGDWQEREKERATEVGERRKRMESFFTTEREKDPYHEALQKVSDLIDALTADLRDIFVKRKIEKFETGYRSGRRWNIRQRIRERVAGIPLFKTEARERKEAESEEMDYAVTLLVDLSGSMRYDGKIAEAFKSTVVLSETLNNLGMKFEIAGFQDILLEFKSFEEYLDEPMRGKLNQMILEAHNENPGGNNQFAGNDDGLAIREASTSLSLQNAKNKFLIVISDGQPHFDDGRKSDAQMKRELEEAIAEISSNTNQKLIGLGLNSQAVAQYYENHIAGITTEEMVETLGELLREVIEKY